jgi:hypothetical protein
MNANDKSRAGGLWIAASALGALAGAAVALGLFPGAGFARNPTGQFSYQLLWFALTVGLFFAAAQSGVLVHVIRENPGQKPILFLLWVVASTIGIVTMLLPMWWVDADALIFLPYFAFWPMLPGIGLLAVLQWLVLRSALSAGLMWIVLTIVGATIGAVVGLLAALLLAWVIPLEITWAAVTGASIGLLQRAELTRMLNKS